MRYLIILLLALPVLRLAAHTGGNVAVTCPLDGTKFTAWQDFSGTSFGKRLDLKQVGPTASPWALPQCPKCHLPLFQSEYNEKEKEILRAILRTPEFARAVETGSSYAALGVIHEQMGAKPLLSAMVYLQASWQLENRDSYAQVAQAAVRCFDQAAHALRGTGEEEGYLVACYVPIELLRRTGRFAEAAERRKAVPFDSLPADSWLSGALGRQQALIDAHDSGSDEAYVHEQMRARLPVVPEPKHKLTATNEAERTLFEDARKIAGMCGDDALDAGVNEVKISLDSKSGRAVAPLKQYSCTVRPGTTVVDDTWETTGTFSLRHPEAFNGREVVFDEGGYSVSLR